MTVNFKFVFSYMYYVFEIVSKNAQKDISAQIVL